MPACVVGPPASVNVLPDYGELRGRSFQFSFWASLYHKLAFHEL